MASNLRAAANLLSHFLVPLHLYTKPTTPGKATSKQREHSRRCCSKQPDATSMLCQMTCVKGKKMLHLIGMLPCLKSAWERPVKQCKRQTKSGIDRALVSSSFLLLLVRHLLLLAMHLLLLAPNPHGLFGQPTFASSSFSFGQPAEDSFDCTSRTFSSPPAHVYTTKLAHQAQHALASNMKKHDFEREHL